LVCQGQGAALCTDFPQHLVENEGISVLHTKHSRCAQLRGAFLTLF